jgi:DNA repair photolyase
MTTAIRVHDYRLKTSIERTPAFEKKTLAAFAVNPGARCGHGCSYCSTGSILRRHPSFKVTNEDPFGSGFAIRDPHTPERVADAARTIPLNARGLIQLCTLVDAWSPEAQEHNLGRRCLDAILNEPGWSVRVLTKNVAVVKDFDLIERYRDRVLVGLSITGPPDSSGPIAALEPHASSLAERIAALEEAHRRGLRTYLMACPLLPGVGDSKAQVDWLVKLAERIGAEQIFVEPVNGRAKALPDCVQTLSAAGFTDLAEKMNAIRKYNCWSTYTRELISTVQASVEEHSDIAKLRILIYPQRLTQNDFEHIKKSDEGVVWLFKDEPANSGQQQAESGNHRPVNKKGRIVDFKTKLQKHIDQEVERRVGQRLDEILAEMKITGKAPVRKKRVERPRTAKKSARKTTRRSVAEGKSCPTCGFATTPPHDKRKHRSQEFKSPFTAEELNKFGLKRADTTT